MNHNRFTTQIRRIAIFIVFIAVLFSMPGAPAALAQEPTPTDEVTSEAGTPDLEVTIEGVFPPNVLLDPNYYTNDDIIVEVLVKNTGDAASGAYTVNLYMDTVPVACEDTNRTHYAVSTGLNPGQQEFWHVTFRPGDLSATSHTVKAHAYINSDMVVECNNADNIASSGPFTVNDPPDPPENDNIENAAVISTLPFTPPLLDVRGATRHATDPDNISCPEADPKTLEAGLASVWYTYTPTENVEVYLDTFGTAYDPYIVIWNGNPTAGGVQVGCNDDHSTAIAGSEAALTADLVAGNTYYIEVAEYIDTTNTMNAASLGKPESDVTAQSGGDLYFQMRQAIVISGNAGAAGAKLSYVDGFSKTVTSGSDGKYKIIVPPNWSGTVTPTKSGYIFIPASRSYANITSSQTAQNYKIRKVFRSSGARDGWVLESTETSSRGGTLNKGSTTLRVGDDAARKQYRAILSFPTGSLPDNAVITKVVLKFKRKSVVGGGNPVSTFNGFKVDIKKGTFGTLPLAVGDFHASASKSYGAFSPTPSSGWYTINLTTAKNYINKLSTRSGVTQIRLRFKLDDNNNNAANYLNLYSGNAGTAVRPQLIIEYRLP